MTLKEIIENIASLDDELTIYCSEPWRPEATAIAEYEPEAGGLPPTAMEGSLKYLLEVFLVNEVLEGWDPKCLRTPAERATRIIEYAINDA